ncbi:MAG: hypothetical protein ACOYL6_08490 [Bacteriovoracaceae bacterium]
MKFFLSFLIIFSPHAHSETCDARTTQGMKACLAGFLEASTGLQVEYQQCTDNQNESEIQNQCEDEVKILTRDETIDIPIIGGYGDYAGKQSDDLFGNDDISQIKENLIQPCPNIFIPQNSTLLLGVSEKRSTDKDEKIDSCGEPFELTASCGFTQTDDPEILIRTVKIGNKLQNVKIRLVKSELTSSDSENRNNKVDFISERICSSHKTKILKKSCIKKMNQPNTSLAILEKSCLPGDENHFQVCRSKYARSALFDEISSGAEFPIYSGHARTGGGPSFAPPVTLPSGHVNYEWYKDLSPASFVSKKV